MSQVADLLIASRAQHDQKRQSTGRVNRDGIVTSKPNYPKAENHIAEALRLRLEAHELDPEHTDPEWSRDVAPHDALVAFYRQYPLIP
jgi:hypothetical protein